jgi:coproporphyrinogen III oxidase-like Fe-S oxidoreductase
MAVAAPTEELTPSAQLGWPKAAYLHIPFCRQRCHYCDFATGLGTRELIETYVQVLCQEIGGAYRYRHLAGDPQPLTSIFFGGGTPLPADGGAIGPDLGSTQGADPVSSRLRDFA